MDPDAEHAAYVEEISNILGRLGITQCGHCGNKAPTDIVASYDATSSFTLSQGIYSEEYKAGNVWELVLCPVCSGMNLRQVAVNGAAGPDETGGVLGARVVYPSNRSFAGLPPAIDSAYQAALKVRHVDANAFAVLLRRVIEGVCLDRGASGRDLNAKLDDLAKKGEIPAQLAEMAHQLRHFGNIGAHFGEEDLTSAESVLLDDLCGAVLEYVYVAPGLLEKLKSRLQELKGTKNQSRHPAGDSGG
ncbi:MAG: DUF4145 domain-containing protein [Chloroflexota bacterium]|nr:DUF4145 domain-containing protein [Chloroflexota bacterium]